MSEKIAHIAVAVKSLKETVAAVEKVLGKKASHIEEVPSQKVRTQFVEIGGVRFEFLEPTSEDSPISKFLEKRGSGIHHVALETNDIDAQLIDLKKRGVPLINETAQPGAEDTRVAFLHPKAVPGILLEYVEHPKKKPTS